MWHLCRPAMLPVAMVTMAAVLPIVLSSSPLHANSFTPLEKRAYKNFLRFGRSGSEVASQNGDDASRYNNLDDAAALDLALMADVWSEASKRGPANKNFLRFGRGFNDRNFIRFGRGPRPMNFIRFGRSDVPSVRDLYPHQQLSRQKTLLMVDPISEQSDSRSSLTSVGSNNNVLEDQISDIGSGIHHRQNGRLPASSSSSSVGGIRTKRSTSEVLSDNMSGDDAVAGDMRPIMSETANLESSDKTNNPRDNEEDEAVDDHHHNFGGDNDVPLGSNTATSAVLHGRRSKRAVPNLFALLNAPHAGGSLNLGSSEDWWDSEDGDDMAGFHYGLDSSEERGQAVEGHEYPSAATIQDIQKRTFPRSFLRYGREPSGLHFIRFGKRGGDGSTERSGEEDSSEEVGPTGLSLAGGLSRPDLDHYERILRARNNKNFLRYGR